MIYNILSSVKPTSVVLYKWEYFPVLKEVETKRTYYHILTETKRSIINDFDLNRRHPVWKNKTNDKK